MATTRCQRLSTPFARPWTSQTRPLIFHPVTPINLTAVTGSPVWRCPRRLTSGFDTSSPSTTPFPLISSVISDTVTENSLNIRRYVVCPQWHVHGNGFRMTVHSNTFMLVVYCRTLNVCYDSSAVSGTRKKDKAANRPNLAWKFEIWHTSFVSRWQ